MSWLIGWDYRKKITLQGSSGAGTNYQILLKVGESFGASGADFHLEGHSANFPSGKNQGGDIRFCSSDGETLLNFWVERVEGSSPNRVAYIWVKIEDNLDSNVEIYIYYGNSSASNYSNGENTFIFFDDFEGDSIDSSKWDTTGSWSVSNSEAEASNDSRLWAKESYIDSNKCIKVRQTRISSDIPDQGIEITNSQNSNSDDAFNIQFWGDPGYNSGNNLANWYRINGGSWTKSWDEYFQINQNQYYTLELFKDNSNTLRYYAEESSKGSPLTLSDIGGCIYHNIFVYTRGSGRFDWIFVRKRILTEPSFLSAYTEEISPFISSFNLEWRSLAPIRFQWKAAKRYSFPFQFQWLAKYSHKFCPNLINFSHLFENPSIGKVQFTIPVSGCLHSFTVNFKNTGTSGNTKIKIYVNNSLKYTLDISADNNSFSKTIYLGNTTLLFPSDELIIEISEVSTDSEDLNICIFEMTFPFSLDVLEIYNEKNNAEYKSIEKDAIFGDADYWIFYLNQPVNSISYVKAYRLDDSVDNLDFVLEDGFFYNNRLKILANSIEYKKFEIKYKNLSEETRIIYVENFNFINRTFNVPQYVSSDFSFSSNINILSYRYSFNDIDYSSWRDYEGNISINLTGESEGSKTLYLEIDSIYGNIKFSYDFWYLTSDIDVDVLIYSDYAELIYEDIVPFKKLEIYSDDTLVNTINDIYSFTGFDDVDVDLNNRKIILEGGDIYISSSKLSFSEQSFDIISPSDSISKVYYNYVVFDRNSLSFKIIASDIDETINPENDNYIYFYEIAFYFIFDENGDLYQCNEQYAKDLKSYFTFSIPTSGEITIKVYDLAGRSKVLSFYYNKFSQIVNFYNLKVSGNKENGEMHFSDNLTFTFEEEY